MGHKVFLCYTAVDKHLAEQVRDKIEDADIKCYDPFRDVADLSLIRAESLAAISSSRVMLYIFTDDANMDSRLIGFLDTARRAGTEIITLRLSASMPVGRIGYYMTIPYTIDARDIDFTLSLNALLSKVRQTLILIDENRTKTPKRWVKTEEKDRKFSLPGFKTGKWYLSLLVMMGYILSTAIVVISLFSLRTSENLLEDAIATLCLTLLLLMPILLLGNFLGLRDNLPVLNKRKPVSTGLIVLLADILIFFIFDILLMIIHKMR